MKIFPPDQDHFHQLDTPGAYEWSYFDGLDETGTYGFTAIFFRGVAMSPWYTAEIDRRLATAVQDRYSGLAFHIYRDGGRIAGGLLEGPGLDFKYSTDTADVKYGGTSAQFSSIENGKRHCMISVDFPGRLGLSRLQGSIELSFPEHQSLLTNEETGGLHAWAPIAPGGTFRLAIDHQQKGRGESRYRFNGRAYHDRNWGPDPLHTLDVDWYWGRVHMGERTFLYYILTERGNPSERTRRYQLSLGALYEGGRLISQDRSLRIVEEYTRVHWTSLAWPKRLELRGRKGHSVTVNADRLVDSGPFYHRMISEYEGLFADQRIEGVGVSEYLRPKRLGVAAFRPFVKFRARRSKR